MPIFTTQLRPIDYTKPEEALKHMANHIKYLQEQLEYTLANLDSSNISEINTNETNVTGGVDLSGGKLSLEGKHGEQFVVGLEGDDFVFTVKGKDAVQAIYLTRDGQLVITKNTTLSIDCGEW